EKCVRSAWSSQTSPFSIGRVVPGAGWGSRGRITSAARVTGTGPFDPHPAPGTTRPIEPRRLLLCFGAAGSGAWDPGRRVLRRWTSAGPAVRFVSLLPGLSNLEGEGFQVGAEFAGEVGAGQGELDGGLEKAELVARVVAAPLELEGVHGAAGLERAQGI